MSNCRDVVFTFNYVTWNDARRRGMIFAQDRLAQTLLRSEQIRKVMIADPFRGVASYLTRRIIGHTKFSFPDGERSLFSPVRFRQSDPTSVAGLESSYKAYGHRLHRAATEAGLERPAVITMHPLVAGFAPLEWAGPVTFYCSDDWAVHPGYQQWWEGYLAAYEQVRAKRYRVCAVSQAIVDRLRPAGPHIVVPNGVDPCEWGTLGEPPEWFTRFPSPRLLYLGTLDSRLDVELVKRAAEAVPNGSIVLAGVVSDPDHIATVAQQSAAHVHDAVPRDQVPGLLGAADACIIPHARTALTTAMSPLKLYEYLAAGRPVASIDLPPLRGLGSRIVLAGGASEFRGAVEKALAMGPQSELERHSFLEKHCWERRHHQILELALEGD